MVGLEVGKWGRRGGSEGEGVPLLGLKVAVIGALDLACLHEDLGRCAVDALLEACDA